ncbi:MAG: cysteine desulfurase [Candidatus Eremiobacteraeota bacterium]|nr:cysteine desulfurase [Candidatus Eremiobacteraeota bacterium]MBC5801727.1 cysteine desulfurase [Candidatus Eremiobacteraeota bacterium]MBC5821524.1 cysteine desulfurase [Candidatus Eremiobacteraeota bacterium]
MRIYADHAATTPLRPEAQAAMLPYLGDAPRNASSLHAEGRRARAVLEEGRASVARLLGAAPRDVVFTSGGTEADNLAVVGAARARKAPGARVVTAATEHPAVLRACEGLEAEGFAVTVLPVDSDGCIGPGAFAAALQPGTVLASIMLANNELGTVQPIAELARIARARGVTFHTDAVAAAAALALDVEALGIDLLSLSAHKFYGPHGVGVLYVRPGTLLAPLAVGGGQENGLRSGTQDVAGAAGLATAFELAVAERPFESARLAALRDRFEATVLARVAHCRVNARGAPRLPNVSSIAFRGASATTLLVALDLAGGAVSAGSACASGAGEPSHVLAALDVPPWVRHGTLRFSFGKTTGVQDVERLARMVEDVVGAVRVAGDDLGTFHPGSGAGRSEVHS